MILVNWPGEAGEICHGLYTVETHILTDNTSRSMIRDNVIKLYLGEATVGALPQVPIPSSGWIRALIRNRKDNHSIKMRYWYNERKSHGLAGERGHATLPEPTGLDSCTKYRVNGVTGESTSTWKGDITGLTVLTGMTAPTLLQAIMPLAMAAFEYQVTRETPQAVCYIYGIGVRSGVTPHIPHSEQLRGFGMNMVPFYSVLSLAKQSLWLHLQHASLKMANVAQHYHPDASADVEKFVPSFVWREFATGSVWSNVIEAEREEFSHEIASLTYIMAMRLGVDTLVMLDGDRKEYAEWRDKNGYRVSLVAVLLRCLTFLCENKEDLVTLTLGDLLKAVWAQ